MDKQITIIGCGPGAPDLITLKGKKAIEKADVLVGSKRLINNFAELFIRRSKGKKQTTTKKSSSKILILEKNYKEVLGKVSSLSKKNKKVVVLVSGDPLFYSYGETIIKKFGKKNCEVIPGISSVQYAFSKLKESWKGYKFFSLHGKKKTEIQKIFNENEKFALLLDPENNLKKIKNKLKLKSPSQYQFQLLSNLSLPDEKVLSITAEDFDGLEEESLSILIVTRTLG